MSNLLAHCAMLLQSSQSSGRPCHLLLLFCLGCRIPPSFCPCVYSQRLGSSTSRKLPMAPHLALLQADGCAKVQQYRYTERVDHCQTQSK